MASRHRTQKTHMANSGNEKSYSNQLDKSCVARAELCETHEVVYENPIAEGRRKVEQIERHETGNPHMHTCVHTNTQYEKIHGLLSRGLWVIGLAHSQALREVF